MRRNLRILFLFLIVIIMAACSISTPTTPELPCNYNRFAENESPAWHEDISMNDIAYMDSLKQDSAQGPYPREAYLGAMKYSDGSLKGYYLQVLGSDSLSNPYIGFVGHSLRPIRVNFDGSINQEDLEYVADEILAAIGR